MLIFCTALLLFGKLGLFVKPTTAGIESTADVIASHTC